MTAPADLVQEACDLLAVLYPRLARETPDPDCSAFAAPGMTARPSASPLPGNVPAFYALTGIHGFARWWEAMLLYAAGADSPWGRHGGSDANTLALLRDIIPKLAAGADDDTVSLMLGDLDRTVDDAQSVAGIDEAQRWRPVPQRPCPYCGCFFLRVLEDARGQPAGRVECFGHDEAGPCRAAWARLLDLASDLDG